MQTIAHATLSRALEVIQERGWCPFYSNSPDKKLNIRSAIAVACGELTTSPADWYAHYLAAAKVLRDAGVGISDWELSRQRHQPEVEALLNEMIQRESV